MALCWRFVFLGVLPLGKVAANPQITPGENPLWDTCEWSWKGWDNICNSWDESRWDAVACYEKGPAVHIQNDLSGPSTQDDRVTGWTGITYAACMPSCACGHMLPRPHSNGNLYDWTCSVRGQASDRCQCTGRWKDCSFSGCCSDPAFTCYTKHVNVGENPFPGYKQCRPTADGCPSGWACESGALVDTTCFTPFSEKAGLVPKGGPPSTVCEDTCADSARFLTWCPSCNWCSDLAGTNPKCKFGSDCLMCGERTETTLGSEWNLVATDTSSSGFSSKLCRDRCAEDPTCAIFYTAFSFVAGAGEAPDTYTMECYTNENSEGVDLLAEEPSLAMQDDTSLAQAAKAVFVKVDCATTNSIRPVAQEGILSPPMNTKCYMAPCNDEDNVGRSSSYQPYGTNPTGAEGAWNKFPTRRNLLENITSLEFANQCAEGDNDELDRVGKMLDGLALF